jgi:hypothetical protein
MRFLWKPSQWRFPSPSFPSPLPPPKIPPGKKFSPVFCDWKIFPFDVKEEFGGKIFRPK